MQDAQRQLMSTPPVSRTIRAAGICMLALAWPVLAASPATRPAISGDTVIRLRPTAVVTADNVVLSDVADLDPETADLAGNWPVAAAPHAGASGSLDAAHLQNVLARRGVNLSNWIFRGASRCVVSKPAGTPPSRPVASPVKSDPIGRKIGTRSFPTTRPATTQPAAGDPIPSADTLEGAIYAHIRQRLAGQDGALSVKYSPSFARLLGLSKSQYQFQIADRSDKALGMLALEVTILENGAAQHVAQVLCEATLRKSVVVAGRSFNRGEIIQADELRDEIHTFDKLEEIGLADASPLIGQRARRLIKNGEQLTQRDVEAVPLVERNDLVSVSVRRGGLTITAAARALAAGSYGDTITLRSESSKETFVGVITGPKKVELTTTGSVALAGGKP
jgi:flagella basal body P-ring formation protein FlgA